MSNNHPLTREKIAEISLTPFGYESETEDFCNDMCAAADWQLEQVIAHIIAAEWFAEPEWRITQLRKAMRTTTPTQKENANISIAKPRRLSLSEKITYQPKSRRNPND